MKKRVNFPHLFLASFVFISLILTLVIGQHFRTEQEKAEFKSKITIDLKQAKQEIDKKNYWAGLNILKKMDHDELSSFPDIHHQVFLYRGVIYAKKKLYQRALIHYQLAEKIKESSAVKLSQAMIYEKLNQFTNALKYYSAAHEIDSKSVYNLEKLADFHFKAKNFSKANEYYELALANETKDKNHRLLVKNVVTLFILKRAEEFKKYSRRISYIEKNIKYRTFHLMNVFNSLEGGDLAESIALLKKLVENAHLEKEKQENTYLLGLFYFMNGNYEQGLSTLALNDHDLEKTYLSKAHFLNQDIPQAIKALEKAGEQDHFLIAAYYFYLKDHYRSLEHLKELKEPHHEKAKMLLIKNYEKIKRRDLAEKERANLAKNSFLAQLEHLNYLTEEKPKNRKLIQETFEKYYLASSKSELMLIFVKHQLAAKNYGLALNYLERYLQQEKEINDFEFYKLAGDLNYYSNGDDEKTIRYYEKTLNHSQDEILKNQTLNNLAFIHFKNKRYLKATDLIYHGLGANNANTSAILYYNLYVLNGYLIDSLKRYDDSFLLRKSLGNINSATPKDLASKIHLAASVFYYDQGKYQEYFLHLKKAFQSDPSNVKINYLMKHSKLKI